MDSVRNRCAIVGIGETEYSRDSRRTERSLALEAIQKAITDAGLRSTDIDGIVKYAVQSDSEVDIACGLGIPILTYFGEVGKAGTAGSGLVAHAVQAIVAGMATNVVVFRSMNGRSGRRYGRGEVTGRAGRGDSAFTEPFGLVAPGQSVALRVRRHMHEYGTTSRQFAAVAVAFRKHASVNPRALLRAPITSEDHQASRMIYDPFRLLDCCVEADGAGALVITSAERARSLRQRPVYIRAALQAACGVGSGKHEWAETPARYMAPNLFKMAGITPKEIDVAQIYDHFGPMVIVALEDYGFCKKGEGGPFVENGRIELGGELPVNTSGGHLSEAYLQGMNHLIEAVRQLRGASTSQVKDAKFVLVDSGSAGALILGA
ncbi:MAG: lipid-transfer protein [Chloroflexi bacterium]|nr:lipid-transfer protein [Chloroflexota bacterium]